MDTVLLASENMYWETPGALYEHLDSLFEFDFDPCPHNPSFDGLSVDWGTSNYVNPPYGREIGKWIKKGYGEYLKGKRVVFLIPSRTDTKYWHDYIMKASTIWFLKGRIRFSGASNPAPFPSSVVLFEPKAKQALHGTSLDYGEIQ